MKKMTEKTGSSKWIRSLDKSLADVLYYHGLEVPSDVLRLQIFDLLNLYKIDTGRADAIVTSLYAFLNPNDTVDEAMSYGEMTQPFSYQEWKKAHRKMNMVTVRDLVLEEEINLRAVRHLLDRICRAFHRSDEYDPRQYRYGHSTELNAVRQGMKNPDDTERGYKNEKN